MLKTLVVGADGSDGAHSALTWVAQNGGDEVHVVHAISPTVALLEAGAQIDVTDQLIRTRERVRGGWLEGTGLSAEDICEHVLEDSPVRAMIDLAHRFEADAIVLGASGHEHIDGLVGATVGRLVHVSDLPLIVVPRSWTPQVAAADRCVVVAVTGDVDSDRQLVTWARNTAEGRHGLHLVHALRPSIRTGPTPAEANEVIEAGIAHHMDQLLGADNSNDRTSIVYDDPVSAVADASGDAAMSVIGTHHSTRLGGFLSGAISQHLPAVSPCPVALVPLDSERR